MEVCLRVWFLVVLFCALTVKELNCAPKKLCRRLSLKNGRVRYRPKTFAQFSCGRDYFLLGDRYSKCINGVWDNPLPVCIKGSCKVPKNPQFGMIYPSYWNALIRFFCMPGYEVSGPQYAYCDGSTWNTHMPSCLPSNVTASVSCDFERPDICGWTHDLNHNFDWERLNFKTPNGHIGTGPKFDHTTGEGGAGYYMYIEASTRKQNDTARLISPVYKKQTTDTCLEFYYHMYGSGIGELRVYKKKANETWTLNPQDAVFTMAGNQGDEWFRGFVELGTIDEAFQIIFEGVRGISYISDIAIDDVRLIEDCAAETTTMTFTTDDYTRTPMVFESCENRCFKTPNETITEDGTIVCDCDENCEERSSCCPDFAAICILDYSTGGTEDTTYDDTTTTQPIIPTTVQATTRSSTPQSIPQTIRPRPTIYIPTRTSTTSTTSRPVTVYVQSTTSTTSTTTRPTTATTREFFKQSTTRQTSKTTPNRSTRTPTPSTTSTTTKGTTPTTTSTTSRNKSTASRTTRKRYEYIDDIASLPTTQDEDVFAVEPSSPPLLSETVTPDAKPSNIGTAKVVIGVTVGVILLLASVFLAKKVNVRRCIRRNMRHNNGDSQSDVRFLTSDEMLDFTLAKPNGDY